MWTFCMCRFNRVNDDKFLLHGSHRKSSPRPPGGIIAAATAATVAAWLADPVDVGVDVVVDIDGDVTVVRGPDDIETKMTY